MWGTVWDKLKVILNPLPFQVLGKHLPKTWQRMGLQPRAGTYMVPGFKAVHWKIEKTTIRDAQGKVLRTIG